MRRHSLFALLFLVAMTARGQQFEIFDLSDFIDPRLHGGELQPKTTNETPRGFSGGSSVTITRLTTGAVANYWFLDRGSDANVAFTTLASSYYHEDNQFNASISFMNSNGDQRLPRWRGTFGYGAYEGEPYKGDESTLELSRFLVSLTVDRLQQNVFSDERAVLPPTPVGKSTSTSYEAVMQTDISIPAIHDEPSFGVVTLALRFGGVKAQRFGYLDHTAHFGSTVRLNVDVGFGVEHSSHWTIGLRPALRASVTVPLLRADIHAVYAPYGTLGAGRHGGNEFALFLDKIVTARH